MLMIFNPWNETQPYCITTVLLYLRFQTMTLNHNLHQSSIPSAHVIHNQNAFILSIMRITFPQGIHLMLRHTMNLMTMTFFIQQTSMTHHILLSLSKTLTILIPSYTLLTLLLHPNYKKHALFLLPMLSYINTIPILSV